MKRLLMVVLLGACGGVGPIFVAVCPHLEATFPCGDSSCERGVQFCARFVAPSLGSRDDYQCEAIPSRCLPAASCDCLTENFGNFPKCARSAFGDFDISTFP